MNAPGFWREVGVALALAIAGALAYTVLAPLTGAPLAMRLVVVALGAAYLCTLLAGIKARIGRMVTLAAWAAATLGLVVLAPSIAFWVLAQVALIWLVRSLHAYDSLFAALADAALSAFAFAAAVAATQRTHSMFVALWCFFLVQALYVLIPRSPAGSAAPAPAEDPFTHAQRTAEAALRRLSTRH